MPVVPQFVKNQIKPSPGLAAAMAMALLLMGRPDMAMGQSEAPELHSFGLEQQQEQIKADDEALMDFFLQGTEVPAGDTPFVEQGIDSDAYLSADRYVISDDNPPLFPPKQNREEVIPLTPSPPVTQTPQKANGTPPLPPHQQRQVDTDSQGLPKPLWENAGSSSPYISGTIPAQSSGSAGQWIKLDVGQADSTKIAPTETPPAPAPGSTQAPAGNSATAPPEETPGGNGAGVNDRQQLRELFSDMLPPESQSVRTALPEAVSNTSVPAIAEPQAPAAHSAEEDIEAGSAILQAGGLLNAEGRFGAAEILPPSEGPSPSAAQPETTPAETAAAAPNTAASKPASAPPLPPSAAPKKPAQPSGGSKTPAKAKKKISPAPVKKTAEATKPESIILINATGNERIGEIYRSVLTKMGYNVTSVGNSPVEKEQSGRTVIQYRPGAREKARAVSRHLPGKKTLVEAGDQVLGAEVMVHLK